MGQINFDLCFNGNWRIVGLLLGQKLPTNNSLRNVFNIYFVYLSVCLSVCLPACLPACLSACLSVCLSTYTYINIFFYYTIWHSAVECLQSRNERMIAGYYTRVEFNRKAARQGDITLYNTSHFTNVAAYSVWRTLFNHKGSYGARTQVRRVYLPTYLPTYIPIYLPTYTYVSIHLFID